MENNSQDIYCFDGIYIDELRNVVVLPVLLKKDGRPIFNDGMLFFLSELVEKKYPHIILTGGYDYVILKEAVVGIFLVIQRPKLY